MSKGKKVKNTRRVTAPNVKINFFARAHNFIREVIVELQKVVWPSKKETIQSTVAVVAIVALTSIYLGLADAILSWLLKLIVT